jgi:hypothetical protein
MKLNLQELIDKLQKLREWHNADSLVFFELGDDNICAMKDYCITGVYTHDENEIGLTVEEK